MKYRAAIFDMDGTVLDTQEDLKNAMNDVLAMTGHRHDYNMHDAGIIFGSGVQVAVQRALSMECGMQEAQLLLIGTPEETLPEAVTQDEVQRIIKLYKPYYREHCAIKTGPYPGIVTLLKELRAQGLYTAVVSNKPDEAVRKLAEVYFPGLFDLAVGAKDEVRRKPYPDMTLQALRQLGCKSDEAVYVGDTEIDIQTAENAQMDCICVNWGFRDEIYLQSCGAGVIVSKAEELMEKILR